MALRDTALQGAMNAGDFDFDLQNFINEVIQNAIPKGKKGIKRLISASKLQDIWKEKCNTSSLQSCYLAKYGLCYTSAVNWYFTHFIKLYTPIVIPNAIAKRQLRLCCLGSGPPLELVAISRIISTWQYSNGFLDSRPLVLHVTVLARESEWNQMNQTILKALLKSTSLLDTAGIVIRFKFRQCDFSLPLKEHVHETISRADILTIARAPRKGSSPDKRALMLQTVMQLMKPHSILFHLGFSGGAYFKLIERCVSSFDNVQQIYGPYNNELYFVTSQCSEYYELVCEKTKIELPCLTSCNVTVAAWKKLYSTAISRPVSIDNPYDSSPTDSQKFRDWVFSLLGFGACSRSDSTLSCRTSGQISPGAKKKTATLSPNQTKPVLQNAGIVFFINVLVHSSMTNSRWHASKSSFNKKGKKKRLQRVQNNLEKYQKYDNLEIAEKMENHRKCKNKKLKNVYYHGVSHFLFPTKSKRERILVMEWKRQKETAK